jgi:hypothetical protein
MNREIEKKIENERTKYRNLICKLEKRLKEERIRLAEEFAEEKRRKAALKDPDNWFRFHFIVCKECLKVYKVRYTNEPCPDWKYHYTGMGVPYASTETSFLRHEIRRLTKKSDALIGEYEREKQRNDAEEEERVKASGLSFCKKHRLAYDNTEKEEVVYGQKEVYSGCRGCFLVRVEEHYHY